MQDKWPKCERDNWEKSARRTHPNRTLGTHQIKHQLVINALYTEYEVSDGYVFISSSQMRIQTRGQLMSQKFTIIIKLKSSLTNRRCYALLRLLMTKHNGRSNDHRVSCEL